MKKIKRFGSIFLVMVMALLLSACAKKAYDTATTSANYARETKDTMTKSSLNDSDLSFALTDTAAGSSMENQGAANTNPAGMEKIIRRIRMEVETQKFDVLVSNIDQQINQLGGYVETANISGRRYYSSNNRYAYIVARVPKDRLDEFVSSVNEAANVVNKEETTENVTLEYVDTESRKKSLEIEQERLFALLEKTDTLENIIALESRLSNVRYELQRYETQLRTFDNLVDYSTVTLNINEVDRMTPTVPEVRTVWDRIDTGFSETMYNLGEGFKDFFVWFIVKLPYLMIWAVIFAIAFLIFRKQYRKGKRKEVWKAPDQNKDGKEDTIV